MLLILSRLEWRKKLSAADPEIPLSEIRERSSNFNLVKL